MIRERNFDEGRIKRATGMGTLQVEDVSKAMVVVLDEDENGSINAVMPDMPVMKVPNWNEPLLLLFIPIARLMSARLRSINTMTVIKLIAFLTILLSFFLGMLTHHYLC